MRPQRARIMPRSAALVQRNAERKLVSSTCSKSVSDICMISLSRVVPALLTRIAIGPSASFDAAKRRETSSSWLTSAWTAMQRLPISSMVAFTSAAASALLR